MNRNKLTMMLVLSLIIGGMLLTGCGESPKEKAMGLLDDLEQAIRDRDDVRAEEISKELDKIDIESLSEEDQMELANRSLEIMGAAFEEAGEMMSEYGEEFDAAMEEAMKEFDY
ncbi:MAG: hypothetical protein QF370_02135 [Candidatus Marinimicrobia bacterium]|nr:hypothetical protein [Candidatus Neomarinimicrobiota bacterium]